MPGRTTKFGSEPPTTAPPVPGNAPADEAEVDPGEELAEDHVVRRFFATHERDLKPGLRRHPPGTGPDPRHGPRRRRQGPAADDEG